MPGDPGDELWLILLGCAIASRLVTADFQANLFVSGAFLCGALSAVFLGPLAALTVPLAAELVGWTVERYRRVMLLVNVACAALPTVIVAALVQAIDVDHDSVAFVVLLAGASLVIIVSNIVLVGSAIDLVDGDRHHSPLMDFLPAAGLNIAMTTAIGAVYAQTGFAVLSLAAGRDPRVHLHGAAGHRRARAHEGVREPLVGRAQRADPHARRARPARGAPLRGGRAVRARHRRATSGCPSATRSSRTPPACCTTSGASR